MMGATIDNMRSAKKVLSREPRAKELAELRERLGSVAWIIIDEISAVECAYCSGKLQETSRLSASTWTIRGRETQEFTYSTCTRCGKNHTRDGEDPPSGRNTTRTSQAGRNKTDSNPWTTLHVWREKPEPLLRIDRERARRKTMIGR